MPRRQVMTKLRWRREKKVFAQLVKDGRNGEAIERTKNVERVHIANRTAKP
jgi:hypothetical protein